MAVCRWAVCVWAAAQTVIRRLFAQRAKIHECVISHHYIENYIVTAAHIGSIRWLCASEQCRSSLSLMYLPQHSFSQSFINNLIRVSWFTRRYYAHEYSPSSRSCALAIAEFSKSSPVRTSCHRCSSTFYFSLIPSSFLCLCLLHVEFIFKSIYI